MARIGGKSQSYIKELSTNDKTVAQLGNDNDSSITLGQLNCIPVATCTTASATAGKVASIHASSMFKNSFAIQHSFTRNSATVTEYLIGMAVKVQFTYQNTADAPTLNIGGTGALPITVNGVRMGAGVLGAGNYTFRLVPYGDNYAWECEDNGGRVSVSGDVVTNSNIGATPLNSALTNFNPKSVVTTNGVYLKLPRKKDGYFLSYLVTAGGFEGEVTQGFVVKKYTNTQWQNVITDIKTDTDYTYLKFNSGWAVSVYCIQAPTQTLTITQTSSSTEFDNAPNQGAIKSI